MTKVDAILDRNETRIARAYNEIIEVMEAEQFKLGADWKATEIGQSRKYAVDQLKRAIKALADATSAIDEAKELL